jgi:hypothetical protein
MIVRSFLIITILVLSALNACRPAWVIEKEHAPSAQVLLAATGSVNLPVLEREDAADLPSSPPRPEPHITIDAKDVGTPEGVVMAFLDDVSEGDVSGAKRFWIPEVWDKGIDRLAAVWATGQHEFSVGAVSYAGIVAPDDYRPLEADDPRVQNALVAASIDGVQGSFALEKTSSGWLISGWIVSDELVKE